jgi:transcriptional regulator with XRE-family HTH domain
MGQSPRPRPKRLGEKLRQVRLALGLTQEQMAERLKDIESPPKPGHISEFELGRREPSLLFLLAAARLAGVPMENLVDDSLEVADTPAGPGTGARRKRVGAARRGR